MSGSGEDDRLRQARAAYARGVSLNRREAFAQALPALARPRALFEAHGCASDVARCDWQRGVALRFLGRLAEAADLLQGAAVTLRQSGRDAEAAQVERDLAIAYNLLERFEDANALIASSRAFFERTSQPKEVALCDLVRGARLRQLTRYQEALDTLNRALPALRSAGREVDRAKTLFMMALCHLGRQAYEEALAHLETATGLFSSANLPMRVAYCDLARGRALWHLGRLREARARMEEARDWFERNRMDRDAADCVMNLGNVAHVEGDYELAVAEYRRARRRYEQLGLDAFVARCDQNLGQAYLGLGRFSAGLDRLHRAAESLEEQGLHVWAADCRYALVEVYLDLRQSETALLELNQARRVYEREGVALREALCQVRKAQLLSAQGEPTLALEALERARRTAAACGSARYVALCDRLRGDLLLRQGAESQAIERYRAARDHFAGAGAVADALACRLGLGRAYARLGEHRRAEAELQAVLRAAADALPDLAWQAHAELGHVARGQGDRRRALSRYQRAIEALRRVRLTLPEAKLAGGFAASRRSVYDAAVRLALELGDHARALVFVEESRAQVLARSLHTTAWPEPKAPYVDDLLSQEAELRAAVGALRRRLLGSLEDPDRPPLASAEAPALLERLQGRQSEHRRVLQRLRAAAGGWLEPVDPFRWERFRAVAREGLPAGWSALIYHWLDERLLIFHADGREIRVWVRQPSPVERAALAMGTSSAAERRALTFEGDLHGRTTPSPVGARYRQVLHRLLIPREVEERLSPHRPLLIVPHGSLHHLPFQALESEEGFLAEQAVIDYAPTLAVLEGLLQRRGGHDDREPQGGGARALLVGIDTFDQPRPSLRWALREVEEVAAIYGERSDRLVNEQATAAALRIWSERGRLSDYTTLHLASHAYLDAASGALSGIALWDDDLTSVEIGRLRLGPAVVVLSACQSGLGEINPGDEIVSPPWAFLAAGAQTVIASLWHVDDESTVDLMRALHARLRAGESAAAALAHAQRQAIRRGSTPYEWGAFLALGAPGAGGAQVGRRT